MVDCAPLTNTSNHFIEPDDAINYADYHYVGAHNAHVYPPFFALCYQQDQPTANQLNYGIRGIMWDTYDFTPGYFSTICGPESATICLSHKKPGLIALMQKGNVRYQSLHYELMNVLEFMKKSPNAIITIILEDYGNNNHTINEIKKTVKTADYNPLLTPLNWQPDNQQWPTLGWMRTNNKRLIIFTQNNKTTDITWNHYSHCIENNYGITRGNRLCIQRTESSTNNNNKNRMLIIFNNFKKFPLTYPIISTKKPVMYETAQHLTSACANKFIQARSFNGYFANRIINSCNYLYSKNIATIFEYVNELNAL